MRQSFAVKGSGSGEIRKARGKFAGDAGSTPIPTATDSKSRRPACYRHPPASATRVQAAFAGRPGQPRAKARDTGANAACPSQPSFTDSRRCNAGSVLNNRPTPDRCDRLPPAPDNYRRQCGRRSTPRLRYSPQKNSFRCKILSMPGRRSKASYHPVGSAIFEPSVRMKQRTLQRF